MKYHKTIAIMTMGQVYINRSVEKKCMFFIYTPRSDTAEVEND